MSLQRRLILTIVLLAPLMWLLSAGVAVYQTKRSVDELYDSQLTLFARQLLTTDVGHDDDEHPRLPRTHKLIRGGDHGRSDEDELGLVVWDPEGNVLITDGGGRHHFPYIAGRRGFYLEGEGHQAWRVFYLPSPDGRRLVAVGQRDVLRHAAVKHVVMSQLISWMLFLPFLLIVLLFGVRRALAPVRQLGEALSERRVDDNTPVTVNVPAELAALIDALNGLFARIARTVEKERRFTSDAAHELRSPLAALRVQAEVARLATDPAVADRALDQLMRGIDRAGRLVEQLLALSRLERGEAKQVKEPIDWVRVVGAAVEACREAGRAGEGRVQCRWHVPGREALPMKGDETLLGLMLRNLIDNALRYSGESSPVIIEIDANRIAVTDEGPGVDPAHLARIRERFYRPPGQSATGSGLGLSIVEEVAGLHGLSLMLNNREPHGFEAVLARPAAIGRMPESPG
ncbi:ATP-binding protein [Paludibacterium paludis]|uniref:histidine kinase n=1 Tax=Paludibacterium paludis TaxID=1225769 RepID=A0A918NYY3_9NEIS|nr:ATP-binding protein [Paludibacterium paludis]GGY08000.1 sensor protein QseC [Paludibacterium paludis]